MAGQSECRRCHSDDPCQRPGGVCGCDREDAEESLVDSPSGFMGLMFIISALVIGVVALVLVICVTWLIFGIKVAMIAGGIALVLIAIGEWWLLR